MAPVNCQHGVPVDESCLFCESRGAYVRPPAPTRFDQDAERLVAYLKKKPGWVKYSALPPERATGKKWSRTYVRHLAQAARGRIMSGQKGYKATANATLEEVNAEAAALLRAAMGCMTRRSDLLFCFHKGRPPVESETVVDTAGLVGHHSSYQKIAGLPDVPVVSTVGDVPPVAPGDPLAKYGGPDG